MSTVAKDIQRDVLSLVTVLAPQTTEQFSVELRVISERKAYKENRSSSILHAFSLNSHPHLGLCSFRF